MDAEKDKKNNEEDDEVEGLEEREWAIGASTDSSTPLRAALSHEWSGGCCFILSSGHPARW